MLHDLGRMIFLASTVVVLFVDVVLGKESLFYWNIIAYGAFFALSAWFIRSRLLIVLHLLYGAVISTALVYHFSFFPFLDGRISQAGNLYGWDQLAAAIETEKLETGAAFVAADNWQHASQLAFAINDPEVPAITAGADAFDQWAKPDRDVGKDAVLLVGRERNLDYLRTQFDSVEHLRHVEVTAWGTKVFSYELYLGRDYHPDAGRPF